MYEVDDVGGGAPLVKFEDAVTGVYRAHAELIDAAVEWAARRGRELDPDVVALLIGAAVEGFDGGGATWWSRSRTAHMFCCHIDNWCHDHESDAPEEGAKEALWLYLRFLVETDVLDSASDPPAELFAPLHERGVDLSGFETEDERYWGEI